MSEKISAQIRARIYDAFENRVAEMSALKSVIDSQKFALEMQDEELKDLRGAAEYYAARQWDYGQRARETLTRYGAKDIH